MNLRIPQNIEKSSVTARLVASQEGFNSLEQVSYVVCSNITKNLVNAVPEKNHSTL
jgi:hypothetical protein